MRKGSCLTKGTCTKCQSEREPGPAPSQGRTVETRGAARADKPQEDAGAVTTVATPTQTAFVVTDVDALLDEPPSDHIAAATGGRQPSATSAAAAPSSPAAPTNSEQDLLRAMMRRQIEQRVMGTMHGS